MTQNRHKNISLPVANKSCHCMKVKCYRSLPSNHPISYTNGLCERHFFSIDLSSSDDDDHDNTSNKLMNKSKLSFKKEEISSKKNSYQSLQDDIRKTRQISDDHQW